MANPNQIIPDLNALVKQYRTLRSSQGYTFDYRDDVWRLKNGQIKFDTFLEHATPDFVDRLKDIFAQIINDKTVSDGSVKNYYQTLLHILRFKHEESDELVDDINDTTLKSWVQSKPPASYHGALKAFIQKAQKKNRKHFFPDVNDAALKKLVGGQGKAYLDVLTLDPDKGPWLEFEVSLQDAALEKAYIEGMHVEKYLVVQLIRKYGPRCEQLANLKVGDIFDNNGKLQIRFPWAKANMSIDTSPWRPVRSDIEEAIRDYLELRLQNIPSPHANLPFFTPEGLPGVWGRQGPSVSPNKAEGFEGHVKAQTLGPRFISVMNSLDLATNRTGEEKPMSFNPHRERHTIGTRLALQGLGVEQIADMLMHTDTSNCEAYVQLGIQHFQLLREKLDTPMAPLASIFLNEPIEQEELHSGEVDLIIAPSLPNLPDMGGGKCGSCTMKYEQNAPFACLTCSKFRVFADANLSLLWDELHRRYAYLYDENGELNHRYDPAQAAQFERYKQAILNAERHRQEYVENRENNAKLEA